MPSTFACSGPPYILAWRKTPVDQRELAMDRQMLAGLDTDGKVSSRVTDEHRARWGTLYTRHAGAIKRYFVANSVCSQDADDLTQALFTKLMIYRRLPEDPYRYLCASARNELRSYWRKKRQNVRQGLSLTGEVGAVRGNADAVLNPFDQLQKAEQRWMIEQAMRGLPATLASVLQLRIIQNLSLDETAQRIGCSRDATKKRLQRAKRRLQQSYSNMYGPSV